MIKKKKKNHLIFTALLNLKRLIRLFCDLSMSVAARNTLQYELINKQ